MSNLYYMWHICVKCISIFTSVNFIIMLMRWKPNDKFMCVQTFSSFSLLKLHEICVHRWINCCATNVYAYATKWQALNWNDYEFHTVMTFHQNIYRLVVFMHCSWLFSFCLHTFQIQSTEQILKIVLETNVHIFMLIVVA